MNVFFAIKSIIYFVIYVITGRIPDTVRRLLRDILCLCGLETDIRLGRYKNTNNTIASIHKNQLLKLDK